jgi:hypothetical protein
VDDDGRRLSLLASGPYAHYLTPIVGTAHRDATYHHVVAVGCLVLDSGTDLREGGTILCA